VKKGPRPAPESARQGVFRRRTGSGPSGTLNGPPAGNLAVAYRRVSKGGQDPENQRTDVERVARARGLELVGDYVETVSAAARTRPAFEAMLDDARRGAFNVLVVWALDRFGRSMVGNVNAVVELDRLGVQVISVREPWIDTGGPVRDLLLVIFSWIAEQETRRLGERTRAGLERARARGARLGRPRRMITPAELELARELWEERALPIRVIARRLRIPRATIHRALERVSKTSTSFELEKRRAERGSRGASRKRTIGGR
jgi:putative DNA-invertase from lambdoid prophage Rac